MEKIEWVIEPYKTDSWTHGGPYRVYARNQDEAKEMARLPKGWTATITPASIWNANN